MKKIFYAIAFLTLSAITSHAQVVVTEINYNNPGQNNAPDSLEFVEIYNAGTTDVNLLGYTFRTAFNDTLPNYSLKPGAYFVTAVNAEYFKLKFGFDPEKQWSKGTLANNSELIELYDDGGALVDSVRYRTNNPWPTAANGQGSSLTMCDPKADNGVAANWFPSTTNTNFKMNNIAVYASPGTADCPVIAVTAANKTAFTYKGLGVNIPLAGLATPTTATITINKQPKNGTAQLAGGGGGGGGGVATAIRYTPKAGFCGLDTIEYKASVASNIAIGLILVTVECNIPYKPITIGKATGDANKDFIPDSLNVFTELVGVVHSPNFAQTPAVGFCIIDEKINTDGIFVARNISSGGYLQPTVGDKVTVRGRIVQNVGMTTLLADTILVTGKATAFAPTAVTSLDESTESALVEIKGLILQTPAAWGQVAGGGGGAVATQFTVTATNGIQVYSIRVNKSIADLFAATSGPGTKLFDLVGIGAQFAQGGGGGGGGVNLTTGYVIMPRSAADLKIVVPAASNDLELGKAISVAPNPFTSELNVAINDNIETLKIVNNLGQVVFSTTEVSGNQTIETSNWSAGVYFLTVEKDGKQFTTKLVK